MDFSYFAYFSIDLLLRPPPDNFLQRDVNLYNVHGAPIHVGNLPVYNLHLPTFCVNLSPVCTCQNNTNASFASLHIALPIQQETSFLVKIIVKNYFINFSMIHNPSRTVILNFTKIFKGSLYETVPCYLSYLQWGVDHQMESIVI